MQKFRGVLKPGETVRVMAINRATGYLGTARTPLTSAAGILASGRYPAPGIHRSAYLAGNCSFHSFWFIPYQFHGN